jgi:hypothetical protein
MNALREQRKALANARLASVATVIQAVVAAVATSIGLALLPSSIAGKVIVFLVAVVPLFLALRSRARATKAREHAKSAADRAWQAAAEDVAAQAKQGVTVPGLAATLGIEPDHAEKLLTALTVDERTRIDVGDDAEIRYSVGPAMHARIDEGLLATEELAEDAEPSEREGRVR